MVIILERYKAERLQNCARQLPRRTEKFRHAMNRTRLRLKSNFDEVALAQALRHLQQSPSHGNGLEFGFGAAAVFESNRSQDGIS